MLKINVHLRESEFKNDFQTAIKTRIKIGCHFSDRFHLPSWLWHDHSNFATPEHALRSDSFASRTPHVCFFPDAIPFRPFLGTH